MPDASSARASAHALTADAVARAVPLLADGVEWQTGPAGERRLRGPPFRRGPLRRLVARCCRLGDRIEVELDEIGVFVIERMDGRTLLTLASDLAAHLKLRQREAEGALTAFLQALLRRKLVRLHLDGGKS